MSYLLHPEEAPATAGGPGSPSPPSDTTPDITSSKAPGSDIAGSQQARITSGFFKARRTETTKKICRVCGDKANSINFNVVACESCKAFFRRSAYKENKLRCPFNGSCKIDVFSRRFCQRCHLFKCLNVGMKKEFILSVEARLKKKAIVEENSKSRRAAASRHPRALAGGERS